MTAPATSTSPEAAAIILVLLETLEVMALSTPNCGRKVGALTPFSQSALHETRVKGADSTPECLLRTRPRPRSGQTGSASSRADAEQSAGWPLAFAAAGQI